MADFALITPRNLIDHLQKLLLLPLYRPWSDQGAFHEFNSASDWVPRSHRKYDIQVLTTSPTYEDEATRCADEQEVQTQEPNAPSTICWLQVPYL